MAEINSFSDIAGLDDLIRFVDRYCMEFMVPECKFDPTMQMALDLTHQELIHLTSDEANAYAFRLHAYCIFLRKELDKVLAKKIWCEEILHKVVGTNWNSFSEYMKFEPKRQAIIAQDTFAVKVEYMRVQLIAASLQSEEKIRSVAKMADILEALAKKKSFQER